jgi:hypothetical protein
MEPADCVVVIVVVLPLVVALFAPGDWPGGETVVEVDWALVKSRTKVPVGRVEMLAK